MLCVEHWQASACSSHTPGQLSATCCSILARDLGETIERVQRRFTKYLPGLRKLTYKERLHHLHLPSLELRRLHADLVRCYKILFGIVETPTEEFFVPSMCASTRGHQYKLFKKPHVSRIRANFFSERVVNSWNFLPDSVDFSSLSRFKRAINKVDFSQFLKCF